MIEIEPVRAWGSEEREIPAVVACALAASGVVKVSPARPPWRWRIETGSHVGIIVGEGWELRIRPHIEVPKLLFLLTYSLVPDGWEGVLTAMQSECDVVQALASGFCLHAGRVMEQGLLRGYVAVDERRGDLRGRVRFKDQLAQLAGLPLPLEVSYDDFTVDIHENRLLRTATEKLLKLARIPPQARARLCRLRAMLEQVDLLPERQRVALPPITRVNQHYQGALVLGKLILDGTSLCQEHGAFASRSFLFDMNEVFESFLFRALKDSMRRFGGVVQGQVSGALDGAPIPGLPLRADIVWRKHGRVQAVIDAKYKTLVGHSSTLNQDAYQMLAYCIAFGVQRGLLVYARDELNLPRSYQIKRHGYEIDLRSVGIEQEPPLLLREVDRIAAEVVQRAHDSSASLAHIAGRRRVMPARLQRPLQGVGGAI
ncbi:MAG: McrC family protein [Solirubrobacteraceae bacterium]